MAGFRLTQHAENMARALVQAWDEGKLRQTFSLVNVTAGNADEIKVASGLGVDQDWRFPEPTLAPILELAEHKLIKITEKENKWDVLLLQALRDLVKSEFQERSNTMPDCPLTPRHKQMLRSLVPGFADGTVASSWTIRKIDDRIVVLSGVDDELLKGIWHDVNFADFAAFERCGFWRSEARMTMICLSRPLSMQ